MKRDLGLSALVPGYDRPGGAADRTRTTLFLLCCTAVNTYVRPRRTFSTVDVGRDELKVDTADTVNTRRPVHTE